MYEHRTMYTGVVKQNISPLFLYIDACNPLPLGRNVTFYIACYKLSMAKYQNTQDVYNIIRTVQDITYEALT